MSKLIELHINVKKVKLVTSMIVTKQYIIAAKDSCSFVLRT